MPTTDPAVTLHINGAEHKLVREPRRTLLDTLRHNFHLAGTKKSAPWATAVPAQSWWTAGPCMRVGCSPLICQGADDHHEGLTRNGQLDPVDEP